MNGLSMRNHMQSGDTSKSKICARAAPNVPLRWINCRPDGGREFLTARGSISIVSGTRQQRNAGVVVLGSRDLPAEEIHEHNADQPRKHRRVDNEILNCSRERWDTPPAAQHSNTAQRSMGRVAGATSARRKTPDMNSPSKMSLEDTSTSPRLALASPFNTPNKHGEEDPTIATSKQNPRATPNKQPTRNPKDNLGLWLRQIKAKRRAIDEMRASSKVNKNGLLNGDGGKYRHNRTTSPVSHIVCDSETSSDSDSSLPSAPKVLADVNTTVVLKRSALPTPPTHDDYRDPVKVQITGNPLLPSTPTRTTQPKESIIEFLEAESSADCAPPTRDDYPVKVQISGGSGEPLLSSTLNKTTLPLESVIVFSQAESPADCAPPTRDDYPVTAQISGESLLPTTTTPPSESVTEFTRTESPADGAPLLSPDTQGDYWADGTPRFVIGPSRRNPVILNSNVGRRVWRPPKWGIRPELQWRKKNNWEGKVVERIEIL